jgi:predicted O-methyltransferase YrrM
MTDVMEWFALTAKENFERFLLPRADEGWSCLQLGCFAGDASVWIMENLPYATLVDVDTFKGSDEHGAVDMDDVKATYSIRTQPYADRIKVKVLETQVYLTFPNNPPFDFIYVDADHHAASVLMDGLLSWPLLNKGGLMAFDDYTWGEALDPMERPFLGIEAFCDFYQTEMETLFIGSQVWVKKR